MAFCSNCGTRLEEGDRFCASCGQALEQTPVLQSAHPAHIDTQQHSQSEYQPQQQYQLQPPPPAQPQQQPLPQPPPQQYPPSQQPTPPAPLQQPTPPTPQQLPQPPQNYPPPQYYYPQPSSVAPKRKPPILIWGLTGAGVVALVVVMILTNMFGLIKKGDGSGSAGNSGSAKGSGTEAGAASDTESGSKSGGSGADYVNTYEIFGDGALIKAPQRLTAKASPDDGISAAALVGPWKGYRNSVTTEYGFADDGCYYKNVTITHAHLNSTYHPGYYSGNYYYYGTWTYNTTYTYTYLDTVVGG